MAQTVEPVGRGFSPAMAPALPKEFGKNHFLVYHLGVRLGQACQLLRPYKGTSPPRWPDANRVVRLGMDHFVPSFDAARHLLGNITAAHCETALSRANTASTINELLEVYQGLRGTLAEGLGLTGRLGEWFWLGILVTEVTVYRGKLPEGIPAQFSCDLHGAPIHFDWAQWPKMAVKLHALDISVEHLVVQPASEPDPLGGIASTDWILLPPKDEQISWPFIEAGLEAMREYMKELGSGEADPSIALALTGDRGLFAGDKGRGRPRNPQIAARNRRLAELAKMHAITSHARLRDVALQDPLIQKLGVRVTAEICRNVLTPGRGGKSRRKTVSRAASR